jgi:hypothetical protein
MSKPCCRKQAAGPGADGVCNERRLSRTELMGVNAEARLKGICWLAELETCYCLGAGQQTQSGFLSSNFRSADEAIAILLSARGVG